MSRETYQEAIRRHYARGMARTELGRIYGRERVLEVIGPSEDFPAAKAAAPQWSLADALESELMEREISITGAARAMGVPASSLSKWVQSAQLPRDHVSVRKIAPFLQMTVAELEAKLTEARVRQGKVAPRSKPATFSFPYELRALMRAKNWTRRDIKDRVGVSDTALSYYFSGARTPSNLTPWARLLGMTPAALAEAISTGRAPVDYREAAE